ncbi:hypothetical protein LPJ72_004614 [Coemansia sp. Benny D160-2]|nr:hypothetical protein LPJ72_004614 [Coemansia sp. Benny D160-2]
MGDSTNAGNDSIYNDEGAFNDMTGYGYDTYQAGNQWLYNDNQLLQMPQGGDDAAAGAAGTEQGAGKRAEGDGLNNDADNTGSGGATGFRPNKDEGKLFVGGLSWATDETKLREYFSKYGTIIDCSIMRDQNSGQPRGFGFVTFDDVSGVNNVLQEPTHTIDGKQVDPKHAIPRASQSQTTRYQSQQQQQPYQHQQQQYQGGDASEDPVKEMRGEKIFVGGLPPSATDADLNSGFVQFGNIVETKLMMDRETGRSRGYGFLQFDSADAALEAVKAGNSDEGIEIHGKRVDVKPAVHRKRAPMGGMMGNGGAGGAPGMGMAGFGMMGMPGYGMMGMPGYGMMGMPGYGAPAAGADGSGAQQPPMGYAPMGYYGGMPGYYGGADASGAPQGGPDAAAAAAYYAQMGMPMGGGYYADNAAPDADGDTANANASGAGASARADDNDRHYGKSSARHHGDDRRGSPNYHRSSRRHGGPPSTGADRSGRDRSRTDRGASGSRQRDEYRGSRGSRSARDRDGPMRSSHGNSSSSRSHGYTPY